MICKYCNKNLSIDENISFCPYCGRSVTSNETKTENFHNELSDSPQPVARLFARLFDLQIFGLFIGVIGQLIPGFLEIMVTPLGGFFVISLWVLGESLVLTIFGITPGKKLAGLVLVHKSNKSPDAIKYLKRSFGVALRGLGLGIPIIELFTLYFSYVGLMRDKITIWYKKNDFQVFHEKNNEAKVIGLIVLILIMQISFLLIINS
jgi:hypothetical protein